jgi:SAM-dependent methyltransferase
MRLSVTRLLEDPLTRGRDLDDPQTTELRRQIVRRKPFLRQVYEDWYATIVDALPPGAGRVLELGSGAGFLDQRLPELITSDVLPLRGLSLALDARSLPFGRSALRAIVMTDVLHHLPDCRRFFHEAARCVRPGGRIVMVEPWVTRWSRLIYGRLHHEPFQPESASWEFPSAGPLSGANGALPWILFARDRAVFERDFPEWTVLSIRPAMPFRYLLSGGVSMRSLAPAWTFGLVRGLEALLTPLNAYLAMFAVIVLERAGDSGVPR